MSMNRTEQDKINRKEANQRYYKLEENKEQKKNYMKAYYKKNSWGGARQENKQIAKNHYEWCKENGRDTSWYKNDSLNITNSERFVNYKEKTESEKSQDDLEPIVNAPMMDKE